MLKIIFPLFLLSAYSFFNLLGINPNLAKTQILYILIGFFVFFLVKKINQKFFFENSNFFYWFFIVALIITYIIGLEVKGSKRWLDFYFFRFQPSEVLKIFFIVYLSVFLTKLRESINLLKDFLISFFYLLIPLAIIINQPDLANGLTYLFIYLMMVIFSLIPKKFIFYLFLSILILLPLLWRFLKPYQRERITSFINPKREYQSSSYNMIQSIIATGSGKFFGRGLGYGTQSKLYFLPERTTDFAFSTLVEQFGFISGGLVISLYFYLIYQLLRLIFVEINSFNYLKLDRLYFYIGMVSYIFFQVFVNVGMNLGLMPVAGVALPVISYGGSAVVTFFLGLALAF